MLKKVFQKTDVSLILVASIGLTLSLFAFSYVQQWEYEQETLDKKSQLENYVRSLRQTFETFSSILHSVNALYHVRGHMPREDFTEFVKHELSIYPGIQALEWIPQIPASERHSQEEKMRKENIAGEIWEFTQDSTQVPASERDIYYPVLFIEPMANSAHELGYDVSSDNVLKTALERARDQGQIAISGAIKVPTIRGEKLGFRAFLPVYQRHSNPTTIAERQKALVGFAVGVFLFEDFIQTTLRLPPQKTDLFLVVYDKTPDTQIKELHKPRWYTQEMQAHTTKVLAMSSEFGGRQWNILLFKIADSFSLQTRYAWLVLAMGTLFTLGLLRYVYVILTQARRAEKLVDKRTESLSRANQALNQEIEFRKQIAEQLASSQQRFQAIFSEAAIGIVQTSLSGHILNSNKAMQRLLQYSEEELQNRSLAEFAHPQDANIDTTMLEKMLGGEYDSYMIGKRYLCKNGQLVWTNQNCSIVRNSDNHYAFLISMIEDISERKAAEEARLAAEKKYREIFENAIEGIFQSTPDGRYLSANPAFVRMFGYDSAEQMCGEVIDISKQIYVDSQRRVEFMALIATHSVVQGFEYEARCRDGSVIWVNETVRVVRDNDGSVLYYEGIVEDITQRKRSERKLRYDASHDQLTGLLNRAAFTAHLCDAIARMRQNRGAHDISFAVLFVDLDRFKIVNDSMGHWVGDKLLIEVATRLGYETREYDAVARFGGDEFALMLENLPNLAALEKCVERIQISLNQPYNLKDETFTTTASIGIALASPKYVSADEMLRDADTAMYEAKRQGRGKAVIFQPGMHAQVVNMLRMESDLRKAFERGEFVLYYQPIISLENYRTVGLEALLRWQHPERGLISPDSFITLTEETGLIKELGLWIFEAACTQLREWQALSPQYLELGMNINVSPIQLKQPRLVQAIQDIIEKTGIRGTTCRVEITEGAMMQDPEAALGVLRELKDLNVQLYIDDFGTGYSSLSYLQKFPIDALKIDKAFIKEINAPGKSTQITRAIIALGEAFNLRVVAEGVENRFQVSILRAARCHHVQGFLFSKPKDAKSMREYLSAKLEESTLGSNYQETLYETT